MSVVTFSLLTRPSTALLEKGEGHGISPISLLNYSAHISPLLEKNGKAKSLTGDMDLSSSEYLAILLDFYTTHGGGGLACTGGERERESLLRAHSLAVHSISI